MNYIFNHVSSLADMTIKARDDEQAYENLASLVQETADWRMEEPEAEEGELEMFPWQVIYYKTLDDGNLDMLDRDYFENSPSFKKVKVRMKELGADKAQCYSSEERGDEYPHFEWEQT